MCVHLCPSSQAANSSGSIRSSRGLQTRSWRRLLCTIYSQDPLVVTQQRRQFLLLQAQIGRRTQQRQRPLPIRVDMMMATIRWICSRLTPFMAVSGAVRSRLTGAFKTDQYATQWYCLFPSQGQLQGFSNTESDWCSCMARRVGHLYWSLPLAILRWRQQFTRPGWRRRGQRGARQQRRWQRRCCCCVGGGSAAGFETETELRALQTRY